MWLVLSLFSAFGFALLFIFARLSRGTNPAIVTSLQHTWGPIGLIVLSKHLDFPWTERWWQLYLILPFFVLPIALWALTIASQKTEVSIVKPLAAFSTLSALFVSVVFFDQTLPTRGLIALLVIVLGLLLLYHGRWKHWKTPWPWIALVGSCILGLTASVQAEVLRLFPNPLALGALTASAIFFLNGIAVGKEWRTFRPTKTTWLLLSSFAAVVFLQDIATLIAYQLAPAAYVIAVKRTSILIASLGGFYLFHERDTSLTRLIVACIIVIIGVLLLSL